MTALTTATNTLTLKLPQQFHRQVESAAKARRISKSELTRLALQQYLNQAAPRAADHKPSMLELAGDLAGCYSGTPDLSTNPKHMEGYGRDSNRLHTAKAKSRSRR